MAMTQMNTRIDSALKSSGDAALADFGYSPSEAVRLLWSFAAQNRHNHGVLADALDMLNGSSARSASLKKRERIESWTSRVPACIEGFRGAMGARQEMVKYASNEEIDEALVDLLEEDEVRIRSEANESDSNSPQTEVAR